MDRNEFIAQLIAALEANDSGSSFPSTPAAAASPPSSSSSAPASPLAVVTGLFQSPPALRTDALAGPPGGPAEAHEAHARLQFDFPELSDAQLRALADYYRRVAEGGGDQRNALPLTNALVDGIAFLAAQSGDGSGGDAEARGLLAAAVLLLLVARCLREADDVRTRALLIRVTSERAAESRVVTSGDTNATAATTNDRGDAHKQELLVKFAAQEDPDDLSQVYEGSVPTAATRSRHRLPALEPAASGSSGGGAFADKLLVLTTRTYSSAFVGISVDTWDAWGLDRCLSELVQLLLRTESAPQQQRHHHRQQLYGHPLGEWTRYLYVLRDRVLRFPNASRHSIRALADLVRLLSPQPTADAGRQQPHHLVYRVLAELALSKELTLRVSQPAQRELAAAVLSLASLVLAEFERLGARRQAAASSVKDEPVADEDEDDDLALVLIQLVRFLLVASSNKRGTADTLQESGLLRALLSLVSPTAIRRSWAAPLLRVVAECALWNAAFAVYVVRVPKVSALLPTLRERFPAELALLLLSFHQHELQSLAAAQVVRTEFGPDGSSRLWDSVVAQPLFPTACASYLESMAKVRT